MIRGVFHSLCILLLLVFAPASSIPGAAHGSPPADQFFTYLPVLQSPSPFLRKNVILLIGDGMGPEHIRAGGMYLHGGEGTLPFEQFPYQGTVTTYSASSAVTDSAAASTAMATGHKVNNGVISIASPGDGQDLPTLLEYAHSKGLSTGLVTTTTITHATPAGFGAHVGSRASADEIAFDYLNQTRPDVLFGGGGAGMSVAAAQSSGYTVVTDRTGLLALDTEPNRSISGQFGFSALPYEADGMGKYPHLSEMALTALNILDNDPDGFFVMIEGGLIDSSSHINDTVRMVWEVAEFARTVEVVLDWVQSHPDTLVVVTADHETGGLKVVKNNGAGQFPDVTWSTSGHTSANVGIYVYGALPNNLPPLINNTDLPGFLSMGQFRP